MDFETIISTVGFPIAMCGWFMIRMEKVVRNNTSALTEVKVVVEHCKRRK